MGERLRFRLESVSSLSFSLGMSNPLITEPLDAGTTFTGSGVPRALDTTLGITSVFVEDTFPEIGTSLPALKNRKIR